MRKTSVLKANSYQATHAPAIRFFIGLMIRAEKRKQTFE